METGSSGAKIWPRRNDRSHTAEISASRFRRCDDRHRCTCARSADRPDDRCRTASRRHSVRSAQTTSSSSRPSSAEALSRRTCPPPALRSSTSKPRADSLSSRESTPSSARNISDGMGAALWPGSSPKASRSLESSHQAASAVNHIASVTLLPLSTCRTLWVFSWPAKYATTVPALGTTSRGSPLRNSKTPPRKSSLWSPR
mmetsp:Transcript_1351/g.4736  ORF Transcript_1351/g.4736 Transcript_1351/m.4736 type:complete len:201 (-) Transcript_1351:728-1330(-)